MADGGDLAAALDLATWRGPEALYADAAALGGRFAEALAAETADHRALRDGLLPALGEVAEDLRAPGAGVHAATPAQIAAVGRRLLNRGAAGVGGTSAALDLPRLAVAQIGICLSSYDGRPGSTYGTRLLRRDVPLPQDPLAQAYDLLGRETDRQRRQEQVQLETGGVAELARRGVRAYAERAALLERAEAPWRIGAGPFAPYELLTGSGRPEVLRRGLDLLRRFVGEHPRFAFAATAGREPVLEMIGSGLRPGEVALVQHDRHRCRRMIDQGNLRGDDRRLAERFADEVAPQRDAGRVPGQPVRAAAGLPGARRPRAGGGAGPDGRRGAAAVHEPPAAAGAGAGRGAGGVRPRRARGRPRRGAGPAGQALRMKEPP